MAHVYRADTVGSLLRPQYLKLAREQFEAGHLAPAAYKEIEDRAVDQAIAMQEAVGLDVVTDGELRRHTFIDQLTEQVEGLTPDPGDSDHIPVPFHDEAGQLKSVFTIPLSVTDKLRRRRMMTVEEYAYARARARRPVKVTLPTSSPPGSARRAASSPTSSSRCRHSAALPLRVPGAVPGELLQPVARRDKQVGAPWHQPIPVNDRGEAWTGTS